MPRKRQKYYSLNWPAQIEARRRVERLYGPDSDNPLLYHNERHTKRVVQWAELIGKAMGMPERWLELLAISASFHDVVQRSQNNETASADQAIAWIKTQDEVALFTNVEFNLIRDTILVTQAEWSPEYGTVVQPRLNADSYPVERALALADLAAAGIDPIEFVADSHKLLAEQNPDWLSALTDPIQTAERQERLLGLYRGWMTKQPDFARGRQALFEIEMGNLSEKSKQQLRLLFGHFAGSIALVEQLAANPGSFDEMVCRVHYYLNYNSRRYW